MYVSEIFAEGIFVTFPWWLKNVKSRLKIALFSNERHFKIWFPKKRTITFFWSKLSKLHKKDPILHVATTFSLKQGETRTSHGPIPHPLIYLYVSNFIHNKGHIFMNFDGMILTFYTWTCVVHCVHQDKCLTTLHYKFGHKTCMILSISTTEPQI